MMSFNIKYNHEYEMAEGLSIHPQLHLHGIEVGDGGDGGGKKVVSASEARTTILRHQILPDKSAG